MKKLFFIIVFLTGNFINCYGQNDDSALVKLVDEANTEMEVSKEDFKKWFRGETLDAMMKNHLEIQKDSVTYVCMSTATTINSLNELVDLKERQLTVFMYVDMNPCFRSLVSYLIENNLPLYQIFISQDKKHSTSTIRYDSNDLKLFGSAL